jgi:hypothetical protein
MGIILTVIVGIIGVVAAWAITHRYAINSSKEMAKQYGTLVKQSREQTDMVVKMLKESTTHVAKTEPEYARKIEEKIAVVESDRSQSAPIWTDGDECPKCKKGKLAWSKWGPGPSGSFTAWFRCGNCCSMFPGFETFGD